jgi:hypothetical protein
MRRRGGVVVKLLGVLVIAASLVLLAVPAQAQQGGWGVTDEFANDHGAGISLGGTPPPVASPVASSSGGSAAPSPYVWVAVPVFGSSGDPNDANQGVCTRMNWRQVLREDAAEVQAQATASHLSAYAGLGLNREGISPGYDCPADPAQEVPVEMVEEFVTATVSEQLPRPTLSLPPGYAITGLRTYLVTEHELTFGPVTIPVDLGIVTFDVQLSATGSSTVDWGDGTVTSHDTGGTGYPDGAINHVYTDAGTVDITVTDSWTVAYEAGPFVGTIDAPLAPVTLAGVEVQERQAVRQR